MPPSRALFNATLIKISIYLQTRSKRLALVNYAPSNFLVSRLRHTAH
ncbi:hypothetical protein HPTD01_2286 [Halomonas sp. TD01]|nr:hypothetical protein HPTD01_2286 [Halomonas sp. TD01]